MEALGVFGCHLMKEKEDGKIITLKVIDFEKNEDFVVERDASMEEISCLCRSFEYTGFLCRHSLCILHSLGVFNIPYRCILKRLAKDVRTKYKKANGCEELQSKKQRHYDLFDRATELIEKGSLSLESYNIAHQALQDALKRCSSVNHSLNLSKMHVELMNITILDTQSKAAKSKDVGKNCSKDRPSNSGTQYVITTITNILCDNTSTLDNTFDIWLKEL
ncbi:Zinc finger, PMZ-type [Corchorus olitorius]|uniref:Protein FAR1-RELATED SEQUENCE n=1 Tax=Corchorus olitorius TaxID=93759 RepID=A0A1R3GSZ6_9ROSI|nr:Zinc finger, PMZ-type [Corchorus olitorius]